MRRVLSVVALLTLSAPAIAQEFFNAYHVPAYALNASANVHSGYMLRSALFPKRHDPIAGHGKTGKGTQAAPKTTFKPGSTSSDTVRHMAALVPAQHQSITFKKLEEALVNYRKIEATLHLPQNDVASGLAAFIAGNYMAYHNASIPDAAYQNLVRQMRTVPISNSTFLKSTDTQKQTLYEQLASMGMYMATEQYLLSKNPNPTSALELSKASKQAFEAFFKMNIDRVKITDKGVMALE